MRTALLFGATGLVGGHCLTVLLQSPAYERVIAFARRDLGERHPKLECRVVDFDRMSEWEGDVRGDDVFCCLGTTIQAAGSREAFRRVDLEYPARLARAAARNGVRRWMMVSSVGASATSSNFYLRTKGECEREVAASGIAEAHFFRPSLLMGERAETRPLERVSEPLLRALSPLMRGPLAKYRPVHGGEVARKMVEAAFGGAAGVTVHLF